MWLWSVWQTVTQLLPASTSTWRYTCPPISHWTLRKSFHSCLLQPLQLKMYCFSSARHHKLMTCHCLIACLWRASWWKWTAQILTPSQMSHVTPLVNTNALSLTTRQWKHLRTSLSNVSMLYFSKNRNYCNFATHQDHCPCNFLFCL